MIDLDKMIEYGICKSTEVGACDKCPFDFEYTMYVSDIPKAACDVIREIILETKGKADETK